MRHIHTHTYNHTQSHIKWKESVNTQGFPGGSLVKSLPGRAGDTSSIPGLKIPHTVEQLSPRAASAEPAPQAQSHSYCAHVPQLLQRSHRNERPTGCDWSSPHSLEKSLHSKEDPAQPETTN